jgi:hypothetical protein
MIYSPTGTQSFNRGLGGQQSPFGPIVNPNRAQSAMANDRARQPGTKFSPFQVHTMPGTPFAGFGRPKRPGQGGLYDPGQRRFGAGIGTSGGGGY